MTNTPFVSLPDADAFWLANARLPLALLDATVAHRAVIAALAAPPFSEEMVAADVEIRAGRIAAVGAVGSAPADAIAVDLEKGLVFPCFVDAHTHLDKGQTWSRTANADGTFGGALQAVYADVQHWNAADLYQRMDFGLRCSYAHGTKAVRTHFDAADSLAETTLAILGQLQAEWQDRLTLQAACLVPLDYYLTSQAEALADLMANFGGSLGGFTDRGRPDLDVQLDRLFSLAAARNLAVDLHVDENLRTDSSCLRQVAQARLRNGFTHPVLCGHCCSLSVQPPAEVAETLKWVKAADIAIVSLPLCNLYLQDRQGERTPRWRGVTVLHELKACGIPVAVASDNCRDPFYGYGDHDGLEVLTQAVRIAHLDRPMAEWVRAMTWTSAELMGLSEAGRIGIGQPADLVLFKARSFNELLSRPQSDRAVLRRGLAIDTTLPDYAELDALLGV